MCFAEATAHRVLQILDFALAPGVIVHLNQELAEGASAQYGFDPPVLPGRHWGTVFLDDAHGPNPDSIRLDELANATELFRVFLADAIIGNRDRLTDGNVLLQAREKTRGLTVVPIDHSEAFHSHQCLRDPGCLDRRIGDLMAVLLPQAEQVAIEAGSLAVEQMVQGMIACTDQVRGAVNDVPAEWIERGGVHVEEVQRFLDARTSGLDTLVDLNGWLEKCRIVEEHGGLDLFSLD